MSSLAMRANVSQRQGMVRQDWMILRQKRWSCSTGNSLSITLRIKRHYTNKSIKLAVIQRNEVLFNVTAKIYFHILSRHRSSFVVNTVTLGFMCWKGLDSLVSTFWRRESMIYTNTDLAQIIEEIPVTSVLGQIFA